MSAAVAGSAESELAEKFVDFYRNYCRDDVGVLAQRYPREERSLEIGYGDLHTWDADVAEDWIDGNPETVRNAAERGLQLYDLPADVSLTNDEFPDAHVRLVGLDGTHYPRDLSPTQDAGIYVGIEGEVAKVSDTYARCTEAAFECQRCGTMTYVPQTGTKGSFQEPHECHGCDRQGPFKINDDQSHFVDAQKLRLKDPPEIATGDGKDIDVYVEDDLAGVLEVGDRTTVYGVTHREQQTSGREKTGAFELWLDGQGIDIELTDHTDIEIASEDRERIHALANGEDGDPLEIASQVVAPRIFGYDHIKQSLVLQLVGAGRVDDQDGSLRGDFHVLLLGDPSTGKSKIIRWIQDVAPRSVGVNGKRTSEAGLLAGAEHDDFGNEGWTLSAGAFVRANGGIVCIDELDDMDPQIRAAMLQPMADQVIEVTTIANAKLPARTAVLAGGNPKYGRFDPYEPIVEQFDFESNLLSRFDLIFTVQDEPDEAADAETADHILTATDAATKRQNGTELSAAEQDVIDTPFSRDILRKWVALAKRQPSPSFESADVRNELRDSFVQLRGANGYDPGDPIPVTWRKLEGIVRVAKAAARFEFSEVITQRHVSIATRLVGRSMQDYGKDEDGALDADVVETGASMTQTERRKLVEEVIRELQPQHDDGVPREEIYETVEGQLSVSTVDDVIHFFTTKKGWAIEPRTDKTVRWLGRR